MKNQRVIWFGEHLRSEWDRIWVREQQVCEWLARDNTLIFVERLNTSNRSIPEAFQGIIKRLKCFTTTPSTGAQFGRLGFVQPLWIPYDFRWLEGINSLLLAYQIRKKLGDGYTKGLLFWIAHPSEFALIAMKALPKPAMLIYQCVDRIGYKSGGDSNTSQIDKEITQKANLVITPSKTIMEEKLPLNRNTHRIPHGAPSGLIKFAETRAKNTSFSPKGNPRICYFGSFHHIFDFELLRRAADYYREYRFILWGPITLEARQKLNQFPNIELAGFLPHEEAVSRLCECDVCIIPYIKNEFSMGVFPHKLFNYLASGRLIVASRLPDLEEFSKWVDLADSREEFLSLLGGAAQRARDSRYMECRATEIPPVLHKYSLTASLDKLNQLIEKDL